MLLVVFVVDVVVVGVGVVVVVIVVVIVIVVTWHLRSILRLLLITQKSRAFSTAPTTPTTIPTISTVLVTILLSPDFILLATTVCAPL